MTLPCCFHDSYSAAPRSCPCTTGDEQGKRTAARRLKLTTPFPPAGRRAGCLSGLDARPCALKCRRPRPPDHAFSVALNARATCSTTAAGRVWASVRAALDLSRLPAPSAYGGAGFAPTSNLRAWARLPRRRRAAPCLRFRGGSPGVTSTVWGRCGVTGCGWMPCPAMLLRFAPLPSGS